MKKKGNIDYIIMHILTIFTVTSPARGENKGEGHSVTFWLVSM